MANPQLDAAQQQFDDLTREVRRLAQASKANPGNDKMRRELTAARRELEHAEDVLMHLRNRAMQDDFTARIDALRGQIATVESELGEATLNSMESPDNTAAHERVASLTAEREALERSIRSLEAAREAAARRAAENTREARAAQLTAARADHAEACKMAITRARELVDWLAELGPRWQTAYTAARDAERAAAEMVRLSGHAKAPERFSASRLHTFPRALAHGVGGAFIFSRIADDGVLAPTVEIRQPWGAKFSERTTPEQMEESMRKAARGHLQVLAECGVDIDLGGFFSDIDAPPVDFFDLGTKKATVAKTLKSAVNKLVH